MEQGVLEIIQEMSPLTLRTEKGLLSQGLIKMRQISELAVSLPSCIVSSAFFRQSSIYYISQCKVAVTQRFERLILPHMSRHDFI